MSFFFISGILLGFLFYGQHLTLKYMRPLYIITIALILTACNQSGKGYVPQDSLGIKRTDTTRRNDTMNYERMPQKTGNTDTSSPSSRRGDTAYYERLPQKSQKDTSR
jgi:hypothetical protein